VHLVNPRASAGLFYSADLAEKKSSTAVLGLFLLGKIFLERLTRRGLRLPADFGELTVLEIRWVLGDLFGQCLARICHS